MVDKGLRILVLDGGGVKGLTQVGILGEIMAKIEDLLPDEVVNSSDFDAERPCLYFDIMAGCGTGGLIGIFLGRLGMTIAECKAAYVELAEKVFTKENTEFIDGPRTPENDFGVIALNEDHDDREEPHVKRLRLKFNSKELEVIARDIVSRYTGDENAKLRDDLNLSEKSCKVFVSVREVEVADTPNPSALRSFVPRRNSDPNCTVWEAICATLAEPELFLPVSIDSGFGNIPIHFFGAGLGHSNPINHALVEADNIRSFKGRTVSCIYSIGAGKTLPIDHSPNYLAMLEEKEVRMDPDVDDDFDIEIADMVRSIARSCENAHLEMHLKFEGRPFYFRFDVERGLEDIDVIQEWKHLDYVEAMARGYLRTAEVSPLLDQAVRVLLKQEGIIKVEDLHAGNKRYFRPVVYQPRVNYRSNARPVVQRPEASPTLVRNPYLSRG